MKFSFFNCDIAVDLLLLIKIHNRLGKAMKQMVLGKSKTFLYSTFHMTLRICYLEFI